MKIIKNDTEIASTKHAHIKDGVAVTKLIKWVKDNVNKQQLTEISVADKLQEMRFEQEGCFDLSFETISGYGPNGAIIHYAPTPETNADIRPEGFLLLDSGAQFIDGTTDITRTISVGPLTQEMIDDYTYVLKSHVDVSMFAIEPGMTGIDFDAAARKPLREVGLDFKHGLAHGVGHVLGVHEGPNTLRRVPKPIEIKAGMVMSNEPGVYIDGKFGVRIENLILFSEDGKGNVVNEPLTCVPYEREAINTALLTDEELAWINDYHKWVRDTLVPLLDEETAAFVIRETEPLTR
jgi:Xaa-Pro aminopeptidase